MRLAALDVALLTIAVELVARQQAPVHLVPIRLRLEQALTLEDHVVLRVVLVVAEALQRRDGLLAHGRVVRLAVRLVRVWVLRRFHRAIFQEDNAATMLLLAVYDYVAVVIMISRNLHRTVAATIHQRNERLRIPRILERRVVLAQASLIDAKRRILLALLVARELVDLV